MLILLLATLVGLVSGATTAVRLTPDGPTVAVADVPKLHESLPDADRVEQALRLQPERPYDWIVDSGGTFVVRATMTKDAKGTRDTKGTRCVLTVWDWHNRPLHSAIYPVPFDERLAFQVVGRGCYTITLDLFKGTRCSARLVRSFAACPDNRERRAKWKDSGFFVGGCSYPGRQHWSNDFGPAHPAGLTEQASRELDADRSARLGLQVVRIDPAIEWRCEDAPMEFARADASTDAFTSRGFRLAIQVDPAPAWAVLPAYGDRKDPRWRYPHREGPTRRIVAEVARRYGKHAAFFEIWNEPDNPDFWRGTVQEYVDHVRWCSEEIRKAMPGATVVNGGYTLIEPDKTGAIVRRIRNFVDETAYHYHGTVDGLPAAFAAYRAILSAAEVEQPRFLNTEMGYAAWRLDVERNMAAAAIHKLLFSWRTATEARSFTARVTWAARVFGRLIPTGDAWITSSVREPSTEPYPHLLTNWLA